jgi:hypothetical protein
MILSYRIVLYLSQELALSIAYPLSDAADGGIHRLLAIVVPLIHLYFALLFLPLLERSEPLPESPRARWTLVALAQLRIANRVVFLFPLRAIVTLGCVSVVLAAVAFVFDRFVIPAAADEGYLSSPQWEEDMHRIRKARPRTGTPIVTGPLLPVLPERTRARRILVMGDSFVDGKVYSNLNDVWWRRLERELRRRGYEDVEVIASGNSGASTRQQLRNATVAIPEYRPDLVIWGYVTNDPVERRVRQDEENAARQKATADDAWLRWLDGRQFPNLSYQLAARRRSALLKASIPGAPPHADWETRLVSDPDNFATLRSVADVMAAQRTPYFFVTLPNYPSPTTYAPLYAPVLAAMREVGIDVHDLLPRFVADYRGDDRPVLQWAINPADGHPGVTSTSFYARAVADILEADYAYALPRRRQPPTEPALRITDAVPSTVRVEQTGNQVDIGFPGRSSRVHDRLLRMPYGEPFVQLGFDVPVDIERIEARCPDACAIRLGYRRDAAPHEYRVRRADRTAPGETSSWTASQLGGGTSIDMLQVAAEFEGRPKRTHRLQLTIVPRRRR